MRYKIPSMTKYLLCIPFVYTRYTCISVFSTEAPASLDTLISALIDKLKHACFLIMLYQNDKQVYSGLHSMVIVSYFSRCYYLVRGLVNVILIIWNMLLGGVRMRMKCFPCKIIF